MHHDPHFLAATKPKFILKLTPRNLITHRAIAWAIHREAAQLLTTLLYSPQLSPAPLLICIMVNMINAARRYGQPAGSCWASEESCWSMVRRRHWSNIEDPLSDSAAQVHDRGPSGPSLMCGFGSNLLQRESQYDITESNLMKDNGNVKIMVY